MKDLLKLIACACCAGIELLTGCNAINEQAEASNTASNTANTNIAAVRPASSNTLENTSTPVKPTAAYTSREPYYTFKPATPTKTPAPSVPPETTHEPQLPVPKGAEFLRPNEEMIDLFRADYQKHLAALPDRGGANRIISYENTCVVYEYAYSVLAQYNWAYGMPSASYISSKRGYIHYYIPVYTLLDDGMYKLTEIIEYSDNGSDKMSCYFTRVENLYNYWPYYPIEFPMHTMASYAYEDVVRDDLGEITGMTLFADYCSSWVYCAIDTSKGSYMYAFPYDEQHNVQMSRARVYRGTLYTETDEFKELYIYRMENTVLNDSGLAPEWPIPQGANYMNLDMEEEEAVNKAYYDYRLGLSEEIRRSFDKSWREKSIATICACVLYNFKQYGLNGYDWNRGMPKIEDIRSVQDNSYDKIYYAPVYLLNSNREQIFSDVILYTVYSDGNTSIEIDTVKEIFEQDGVVPAALPMHTMAHYMYTAVVNANLGSIDNMMLFADADCSYLYGIIETDSGSYIYDFGEKINLNSPIVRQGKLYTDAEEFRQLYTERMNNPHFVEGGLVVEPIEPEK